jgi:hypothetical protein
LNIYKESQSKNISDLIEEWFLDDDVLELLIRNQKVEGNTSLDLARIMKIDENWVMPKLNLDGDVWRRQQLKAQTIQSNMLLKQGWITIDRLENIWEGVQRMNFWIDRVNLGLEVIGDQIDQLNFWIDTINDSLESIDENLIFFGDSIIENQLKTNTTLDSIRDYTIQTNEFLYGLLNVWIENVSLLEESNSLSKITNQLLWWVSEQIQLTWSKMLEILQDIGSVIVEGYNQNLDMLEKINATNIWILETLYNQSKLLESIDHKMDKPLDIQANEYFTYGMEMISLSKSPSKEYWKDALKSFKKWLKLRVTHLYNLYGTGVALKNLEKDKEAAVYLQKAYNISFKSHDVSLAKNIALDLAKIYTRNLQMNIAKYWIDQAILNDSNDIEIYLFKARITNILDQKDESKIIIDIIANKIVGGHIDVNNDGNDADISKSLNKSLSGIINLYISQKNENKKLFALLPKLQKLWYIKEIKKITAYLLFNEPQILLSDSDNIRNIISNHRKYFESMYIKYSNIKLINWSYKDLYVQAYLWYETINWDIISKLISTWLAVILIFVC